MIPSHDGLILRDRVTLRPVQLPDGELLLYIFESSRPDLEWAAVPHEEKKKLYFQQYTAEEAYLRNAFPDAERNMILFDGKPVGRLYIHKGEKGCHIITGALLPEYRSRGIGTYLVKGLLQEALAAGKSVSLQVAWYNHRAYSLYERLGFKVVEDFGVFREMRWEPEVL